MLARTAIEAMMEATIEATIEAAVEAMIEATIEATIEAMIEGTIEATIEATIESCRIYCTKSLSSVELQADGKPSGDKLPRRLKTWSSSQRAGLSKMVPYSIRLTILHDIVGLQQSQ